MADGRRKCRDRSRSTKWLISAAAVALATAMGIRGVAQETASAPAPASPKTAEIAPNSQELLDGALSREGISSTLQLGLLLAAISLAPAALLMTTSFIRLVVVLGLLRQALGTGQLPPTQVLTSIALFLTLLIMAPVWRQVYDEAVAPYQAGEIALEEAWRRGQQPLRRFMSAQIERTDNADDVWLFLNYLEKSEAKNDAEDSGAEEDGGSDDATKSSTRYVYYGADADAGERDVPLEALAPAFMLSELKTAFLIGFQIYLPFLIVDLVVASVTLSMGMFMLPPALISLPFKLLLFVLLDGWTLVVEMLLESFQTLL